MALTFPWADGTTWHGAVTSGVDWSEPEWVLTAAELKSLYFRIRKEPGHPFGELFYGELSHWPSRKCDRALQLLKSKRLVVFMDGGWKRA